MPVVLLGLSHRTAPADVRDRHAMPTQRLAEALRALGEYSAIREAAILSTCNRLEIYADVESFEKGVAQLKEFLTRYRQMDVEDFDKYLYTMLGGEAVEQLLRVACGLDSMLVGEPQILSQVKDALRLADSAGTMGPNLGRLFRAALQTGKQARTDTAIGRDVVSLGAAAVELASRHCEISQSRCAVIGAGHMGSAVAKHLHARGARSLTIVNRSQRRAASLARQVDASTASLVELPEVLARHDLIITAIGRGSFILDERTMRAALGSRSSSPLLVVDIGVPRDVEPSAALLPQVVMYSIEDLREVVDRTLEGRRSEIPRVEEIVALHLASYLDWYRTRGAAPLIASLRRKAEEIRAAEIERLFARMPELGEAQRQMVVAASVTIINRLLHAPVTKLRKTMAQGVPDAETQLAEMLDPDAFSDRLLRHLDSQLFSR